MARSRSLLVVTAIAACALALSACSSSDGSDSSASTTTADSSSTTSDATSAATIRFDKQIQQELADVGCYPGGVDGIIGAKTDAAIIAFQTAESLEVDGELGPETDAALKKAAAAGTTVCNDSTTTTAAPTTTTATTGGSAPCTAAALLGGLPAEGESIGSFICIDGYAAGTLSDGTTKFILESDNGAWVAFGQDPCGSASAGLPPQILEDGC